MLINLSQIILENEQLELLDLLVEASRNTPREKRQKFIVIQTTGGDILHHLSLEEKKLIYIGDVEILANNRLLSLTQNSQSSYQFDVTPIGFKYYEYQKNKINKAHERIEESIKKYFDTTSFASQYPNAYNKWLESEKLLWSSESTSQFTLIGHICREAIQEFIQHLIEKFKVVNADPDKSKTVSRLRAILNYRKDKMGETVQEFNNAILAYWGTLNDLIQRQEHGAQKENEYLTWEDSRRVVFQSMIVMYELDRSIS